MVAQIARHGLAVTPPSGWEAQIYVRDADHAELQTARTSGQELDRPAVVPRPILHAATFALPPERGDFGGGAVEHMSFRDAFVSILDFGPENARQALFSGTWEKPLNENEFAPDRLQRPLPGQGGMQRFFSAAGRGWCLYVVLGSYAYRRAMVTEVQRLLDGVDLV